jgi:hypothetical protein
MSTKLLPNSFLKLEDSVEMVNMEGSETAKTRGKSELPELFFGPVLPFGPVDGHDKDVTLKQCPSSVAIIGILRQNWLTSY